MAVLREIIASFAVNVDNKPLTELDRKIDIVKANIARVAGIAATAFGVAAFGGYQLVEAASKAQESLNVLTTVFGQNSASVVNWSHTLGEAVGRSAYELQDAVGRFGAFLDPMFKGTDTDISKMSKKLSGLAVDLASFYNTSDEEAQMRLFSGMSGETEAVRRLGVDISDTALDDLNKSMGDNRRLASLTLQEKTLLRFKKIMIDTSKKQGDAERTAGNWANSLKRVNGQFKTMAVEYGQKLMPTALALLLRLEVATTAFGKAIDLVVFRTGTLQTALLMAGAAAGFYAGKATLAALATGKLNQQLLLTIAHSANVAFALGAMFILFEDLYQFFNGNNSVFGTFLTEVTGLTDPLKALNDVAADMATHFMNAVNYLGQLAKLAVWIGSKGTGAVLDSLINRPGEITSFLQEGQLDVGHFQKQRELDNDSSFRASVESGDYQGAVDNYRHEKENKEQALARVKETRREILVEKPWLTTPDDVKHGVGQQSASLRVSPVEAQQQALAASLVGTGPGKGPLQYNGPMVGTINIYGVKDAEEAAKKTAAAAAAALNRTSKRPAAPGRAQ